jgi:Uma2 family endonuclease
MQTVQLYTIEDLEAMHDPDHKYELDEGRLVQVNPPQWFHGYVTVNVSVILTNFVKPLNLGYVLAESGVVLQRGPDTLRGPDVWYMRRDRLGPAGNKTKYLEGGPDLVVEILSPSNEPSAVLRKVSQYLAAGSLLVWVVDPPRARVTVYHPDGRVEVLTADDELRAETVLPGFSTPVRDFFE